MPEILFLAASVWRSQLRPARDFVFGVRLLPPKKFACVISCFHGSVCDISVAPSSSVRVAGPLVWLPALWTLIQQLKAVGCPMSVFSLRVFSVRAACLCSWSHESLWRALLYPSAFFQEGVSERQSCLQEGLGANSRVDIFDRADFERVFALYAVAKGRSCRYRHSARFDSLFPGLLLYIWPLTLLPVGEPVGDGLHLPHPARPPPLFFPSLLFSSGLGVVSLCMAQKH